VNFLLVALPVIDMCALPIASHRRSPGCRHLFLQAQRLDVMRVFHASLATTCTGAKDIPSQPMLKRTTWLASERGGMVRSCIIIPEFQSNFTGERDEIRPCLVVVHSFEIRRNKIFVADFLEALAKSTSWLNGMMKLHNCS
jgi:hypothetical protein